MPALFAALRERGIRIGVLSNTLWPRDHHERIFERDEVLALIDGAVYTSEIAWTKPHAEAFRAALAAVGVADPAEAVFVGDRLFDDIHGAKSVGHESDLDPAQHHPGMAARLGRRRTGRHVTRLSELVGIIDSWQ